MKIIDHPYFWIYLFAGIILAGIIFNLIYLFTTKFTKTITVKDKYNRFIGRRTHYMFTDTNGDIYRMGNVWYLGEFDEAEDWTMLEAGKTYTMYGYGIRFPAVKWYPTIYKVTPK